MDSSRDFPSIRVIIFVISLRLLLLIDLEGDCQNFSQTKQTLRSITNALQMMNGSICIWLDFFLNGINWCYLDRDLRPK
jgi:cell shape-determining protein MreC